MQKTKLIYLALISTFILSGCGGASNNPSSNSSDSENNHHQKSIGNIVVGNLRIQLLDEQTIRFEEKKDDTFLDDNTFFIPQRDAYEGVIYNDYKEGDNHIITFNDITIIVPYECENFNGIMIKKNDSIIYNGSFMNNTGSLPSPSNTPDAFPLVDKPRIVIPEDGYSTDSYYNNTDSKYDITSGYKIQNDAKDLYVLLPLKNAKLLRQAYVNLTGKTEMVRLANLGSWDSKYYAYSEKTAQDEIDNYKKYNLPLDNLVIDTDWRQSSSTGIGYDVNTTLFPDMAGFLEKVHNQNIEVMFNDHPEPVSGTGSVLDVSEIDYRKENLTNLLEMGLDTWWYDRNWTTALKSPTPSAINHETWGMYLFHDITKQHYQNQANNNQIYRRPVIMANADNIYHGKYNGIKNSASHRYSIQWTGDINADSSSLQQEISDIIKSGIDATPYMSSDLGGHNGNPSNELYTRWIQYGALSPIFRPHSSKYNQRYRQPWLYGEDALNISRDYINLRYRLMALYYSLAYENYQTGMPLIRSLEFNYPNDELAQRNDEYLIGNNILFAPMSDDIYNVMPTNWFNSDISVKYYNNKTLSGTPVHEEKVKSINFNWGTGKPSSKVNADNFSASFEGSLTPEQDTVLAIKADDGVRVYVDGELKCDKFIPNDSVTYDVIELKKGTTHTFKIEYYEDAGNALISLLYKNNQNIYTKEVYLPEGDWLNVFNGEIYTGKNSYSFECDLKSTPLFVRLGSMTPLVENTLNTASIDWNNISYDIYPSKNASDEGFIYEDDHQTTAYKYGQNRISNYSCRYDKNENAIVVNLKKGQGTFTNSEESENKNYSLRYHLLEGMNSIKKVTLNGKVVSVKYNQKNKYASPFAFSGGSLTEDIVTIDFNSSVLNNNEIKIYLS